MFGNADDDDDNCGNDYVRLEEEALSAFMALISTFNISKII